MAWVDLPLLKGEKSGDGNGDRAVRFANGASPRLFSLLQSDFHSALDGGFGGNGGRKGSGGNEGNGA